MTTDVIRLAKEAHGALITEDYPGHTGQLDPWTLRLLERFTALVMEECAKVCEKQITGHHFLATHGHFDHMDQSATNCAAAIRAKKPA